MLARITSSSMGDLLTISWRDGMAASPTIFNIPAMMPSVPWAEVGDCREELLNVVRRHRLKVKEFDFRRHHHLKLGDCPKNRGDAVGTNVRKRAGRVGYWTRDRIRGPRFFEAKCDV